MISLRPYQTEAIAAVQASDKRRQMVVLPTGTGKTVVFSSIVKELCAAGDKSALILAHRDELLQQAADKLQTVAPELAMSVGFVQAKRNDTHAPIVIGSVQTLAGRGRLEQLPKDFEVVIVDEAHHAVAPTYRRILDHVSGARLILGFTATPERTDKKKGKLDDVFEEISYAKSIEEMIRSGYLCNLRALRVEVDELDLSEVKRTAGDFQDADLARALGEAGAVDDVVASYVQHASERRAIAFLPSVELSQQTAAAFEAEGIAAVHIDGETPREERRETIKRFRRGEVDVMCNVDVFTEGFDEPSIECVIVGRPTKSRIKYAQMVGRGTRIHPGKTDCLVLDVAGASDDLTIQSIGVLFGAEMKPGEDVISALDRKADEEARREMSAERKRAYDRARRKARTAELFSRDRIHWIQLRGRWIVSLKGHDLVLDEYDADAAAGWRVLQVSDTGANVVQASLDFGYAQGVVEQLVRDAGAEVLADTEAPWRLLDASDKQLKVLARMGVALDPKAPLTKGEAADLITQAFAERRLQRLDRALGREEVPTHA